MPSGSFFIDPFAGPTDFQQVSPMSDPSGAFGELYNTTRGIIPTSLDSLSTLIGQGMNSPLLQQILGPALARLMGTEQTSRDAVTDMFRSSGGLRGTPYAQAAVKNEQNLMGERSNLISDTIAKNLATLVSGQLQEQRNSFLPGQAYSDLLRLMRPDVVRTGGGGGGGGGSFSSDPGSLGPSIFDPAYSGMIADWQRRVNPPAGFNGYNMEPGLTGVNYKPNPLPVDRPYYDPWSTNQPLPISNKSQPNNGYPSNYSDYYGNSPYGGLGPQTGPISSPAPQYGPWIPQVDYGEY
jgi:hypothetical protein